MKDFFSVEKLVWFFIYFQLLIGMCASSYGVYLAKKTFLDGKTAVMIGSVEEFDKDIDHVENGGTRSSSR